MHISTLAPVTHAIGTNSDGEESLHLYLGKKEVSVAGDWVPFLETMLEKQRFVAESAIKWAGKGKRYPWGVAQEYLQVLLAQGFLERAEA